MTELLTSGPLLGALLAGLAAALAAVGVALFARAPAPRTALDYLKAAAERERDPGLRGRIERSRLGRAAAADLERAGMTVRPSSYLGALAGTLVVGWFVLPTILGTPLGQAVAVVAAAGPYVVVRRRSGRHAREFARQLPAVLDLLASALRAGQSEVQAFALVADEMRGAAAEEFDRVRKQIALGSNVEAVTQSLLQRVPSADLEMVVDAIQLSHRVGGNLAQMLSDIATTIRDRARLEGEIRALTAQGRASLYLVTALAPVGVVAISLINPAWGQLLFTTTLGLIVLGTVAVLEVVGFLVARRAAAVEV